MNATNHETIVVGLDKSDVALDAAIWAARLADRLHAPLLLAYSVVDPHSYYYYGGPTITLYPDLSADLRAAATATLDRVRAKIASMYPDVKVDTVMSAATADIALVQLSAQARLTVVGAHYDSATGRTLIGPTALRVATHARGPVAVWRGDRTEPVRADAPVVVGVDGTAAGAGAIDDAFALASALEVPLTAVHTWLDGTEDQAGRTLAECLAGYAADYPDVEVRQIVQDGPAALALLQWSEYAQALVVASRVRNSLLATLLGSTSQHLLHHATVPLLIHRG